MATPLERSLSRCKTSCGHGGPTFEHFCKTTSIHGLKYVAERDNSWVERILWGLVFIAGLGFSGYFCMQMWNKWEASPIITTLDSARYPLSKVDFPAVTICNVNKVSNVQLLQVLLQPQFLSVPYPTMQNTLRYMTKLDRAISKQKELDELNAIYNEANISSSDLLDVLKQTAPSCQDLVMDCVWLGLSKPCMDYFSFLPTDDGMCCVFNGANYSDPDVGIQSNNSNSGPLRVSGNGYRMGLALVLNANIGDYSVTNGKYDGFKVLVHSPGEFPDVSDRGFVMSPGTETFVGVRAVVTKATDAVRKIAPKKRGCVMDGEVELKYFANYSQSACLVECATQLMQDNCQCRPYFFRADAGTPLCNMSSYACLSDVYERVRQKGKKLCRCLPPCTDVWYEPEISYASFPGQGFNLTRTFKRLADQLSLSPDTDVTGYFQSNVAVLHVYYKEKTGIRYQTDVRFGVEDFISSMGGLLSLGMGLSFISLFELFYFICIRCHMRHKFRGSSGSEWPPTATGMVTLNNE